MSKSSVPNLEFYPFSIDLNCAYLEVHTCKYPGFDINYKSLAEDGITNGGDVVATEMIISKSD